MEEDQRPRRVRYREAVRHPVVRQLWLAGATSTVGDYVGQGALLILAHQRTGQVVASAGVLAVGGLAALATGALAGPVLDRLPRRRALVALQLAGALAIALPIGVTAIPVVYLSAALLGAVRAATTSVRSAIVASSVPAELRGAYVALNGTTEQANQVLGFLTGASLTLWLGAATALGLDALSFLVGAVILLGLRVEDPGTVRRRTALLTGLRDIFDSPVLRILAPLVWVGAAVGGLPEALAAGVSEGAEAWTPLVFAAAPAGQAVTITLMGRTRHVERPSVQLTHLAWLALAFGISALGRGPAWFALTNFLVGSGVAWSLGPNLTFYQLAPTERMAQISGTMLAVIIPAEGLGSLLFAAIADRTGSPATAYRAAGFLVLAAAVVGWAVKERTPEAAVLDDVSVTG